MGPSRVAGAGRSTARESALAAGPAFSRAATVGWVMYDFANSAFVLSVVTAFFPVFLKKYWCVGHEASFSTIRLNLASSAAGLLLAVLAPLLGALGDAGHSRKRLLLLFMGFGVAMTVSLAAVGRGDWALALTVFIVANVGFSCANLFYDSLLPSVAPPARMDMVSSLGFATGYLGGGALFALNLLLVAKPHWFGLPDSASAVKIVFVTVAVWWAVFALPLVLWVKEGDHGPRRPVSETVREGLVQLRATARDVVGRREVWLFLLAYWLYIDGVQTFIRAAADLGLSIGLKEDGLLVSLLVVQIVAFPSAYAFGLLAQRIGGPRCIMIGIAICLVVTLAAPLAVHTQLQFGLFAALSAVPLGALQALSRSYFARLIPPEKSAEYFGFYDLMGKFAVMLGPLVVASAAALVRVSGGDSAQAARFGCASLTVFFVAGGALLMLAGRARDVRKDGHGGRHASSAR